MSQPMTWAKCGTPGNAGGNCGNTACMVCYPRDVIGPILASQPTVPMTDNLTAKIAGLVETLAELQLAAFLAGRGSIQRKASGHRTISREGPTMDDYRNMARNAVPDILALAAENDALKAEVERLRERLEIPEPPFENCDGIDCRDETIRGQDATISTLRAQLATARREGMEEAARIAWSHYARIPNHNPDVQRDDLVAQGYGNASLNIATAIRTAIEQGAHRD